MKSSNESLRQAVAYQISDAIETLEQALAQVESVDDTTSANKEYNFTEEEMRVVIELISNEVMNGLRQAIRRGEAHLDNGIVDISIDGLTIDVEVNHQYISECIEYLEMDELIDVDDLLEGCKEIAAEEEETTSSSNGFRGYRTKGSSKRK